MRDSTSIIATILRIICLGFWFWAAMHLIAWVTHPIVTRIDPWGTEVFDPRRLVTIGGCIAAGAVLYWISLPLAARITAVQGSSRAFALAFSAIRMLAFCGFLFAVVWISLALFELLVRRATEHLPGQIHVNARWLLRMAFTDAFPFLVFGLVWFFAAPLAHVITRRLSQTKVT